MSAIAPSFSTPTIRSANSSALAWSRSGMLINTPYVAVTLKMTGWHAAVNSRE
jgi:hypothetical protein